MKLCIPWLLAMLLSASDARSADDPPPTEEEHHHSSANAALDVLMGQASGTSANPAAEPMTMMTMSTLGRWTLMFHGVAFLNQSQQTGPRGRDKTFSTNWMMLSAMRPAGSGAFLVRSMLSLEPATISKRLYPELFQTGETAFGKQIIDGQHPHDFFMELAAEYAHPIGQNGMWNVYVAPAGDPALGPVAFPHRTSAKEIPQAVLSHHFQDSTHISSDVVTLGLTYRALRIEGSAFHGAEPDERRWDFDSGPLDSYAARLSFIPSPRLTAQVSYGYLTRPEKLEPGDQKRATATLAYTLPLGSGMWASSVTWGQIYKESHDSTLDSYIAESTLHLARRHWLGLRYESVDKDELFPHRHPTGRVERPALPVPTFRIKALTLGYTWDFLITESFRAGAGANYTWYRFPEILEGFYGERPRTTLAYLRVRFGE